MPSLPICRWLEQEFETETESEPDVASNHRLYCFEAINGCVAVWFVLGWQIGNMVEGTFLGVATTPESLKNPYSFSQ
jgi:hypothetical protein